MGRGGYGLSKAALEQASHVLSVEEPDVRVWWVDPGDLRTAMHQAAPRRGHLRSAVARDGSSCIPAASRGATAERPAPARRPAPTGRNERVITTFVLPPELEAFEPAEVRGRGRDDVRLLVGRRSTNEVEHRHFRELPSLLQTRRRPRRQHVNDPPRRRRRRPRRRATRRPLLQPTSGRHLDRRGARLSLAAPPAHPGGRAGTRLELPGGALTLLAPFSTDRLWVARADRDVLGYLARFGRPIRYGYVKNDWPLSAYSTIVGTDPGSAEMPSASRPSREPSWID